MSALIRMDPDLCTYCVTPTEHPEHEHVFPRSWYPDSTARNIEKPHAPSCRACNDSFHKIEDRLRLVLSFAIDPSNPCAAGLPATAARAVSPAAASQPTDAFWRAKTRERLEKQLKFLSPQDVDSLFPGIKPATPQSVALPNGETVTGNNSLLINSADLAGFTEKLARGLYWYEYRATLSRDVIVASDPVPYTAWSQIAANVEQLEMVRRDVPPGLTYWHVRLQGNEFASTWYIFIWGALLLQAWTSTPTFDAQMERETERFRNSTADDPAES